MSESLHKAIKENGSTDGLYTAAEVEMIATEHATTKAEAARQGAAAYIAAIMYQALGSIESSAMPDGEWQRCMDWLIAVASCKPVEKLLPVCSNPATELKA